MKHITCFTANLCGGGAEHQLAILSNLLAEKGYKVTLVTYNNLPDHFDLNPKIERVFLNVDHHNSFTKQWIVSKFFWTHKTDCIISFRSVPNFILLAPMFFTRAPKIIVGERNTTIRPSDREKINYNVLYNRANYVVPNSYTQGRYLQSLNKRWSKRVVTITNYTDIEMFSSASMPTNFDVIKIGVFARIFPQKNYVRFCEMVAKLKTKTNRKFKITWYGDRTEGEFIHGSNHIHELIKSFQIADVLEVKEAVKDVCNRMDEFHAMCLPSLYEGFSNALSEYISCGKAVLCSDVSDNSLMVEHNQNGFLFDPKDINSMCEAFLCFFELSEEHIRVMGEKSRKKAELLFNKEKFINSYIKLIES